MGLYLRPLKPLQMGIPFCIGWQKNYGLAFLDHCPVELKWIKKFVKSHEILGFGYTAVEYYVYTNVQEYPKATAPFRVLYYEW